MAKKNSFFIISIAPNLTVFKEIGLKSESGFKAKKYQKSDFFTKIKPGFLALKQSGNVRFMPYKHKKR